MLLTRARADLIAERVAQLASGSLGRRARHQQGAGVTLPVYSMILSTERLDLLSTLARALRGQGR